MTYRVAYRNRFVDRMDVTLDHDTLRDAIKQFAEICAFSDLDFVRMTQIDDPSSGMCVATLGWFSPGQRGGRD